MQDWSDPKKWWMDLLKSILSWAILAIIGYFSLGYLEEQRILRIHKLNVDYSTTLNSLLKFSEACDEFIFQSQVISTETYKNDYKGKNPRLRVRELEDEFQYLLFYMQYFRDFHEGVSLAKELDDILARCAAIQEIVKSNESFADDYDWSTFDSHIAKIRSDKKAVIDSIRMYLLDKN
ncbi:hypothetical protein [uncultured Imperialibacter sp.]|uniref:hypothetical protein n=1 Tax=uncultured Imperialibacter sp. TaxID=1672639 RepID=UPI0030D7C6A2|tara:strand:- start:52508 stop:53041 length:534 start_codon:yes stop_codon:yes gene_type:complete